MAVDCVVAIAAKIGEYLVAPIGRQLGYLIFYNNNIDALRNQAEKLKNVEAEVQGFVDAAARNGEVILQTVQTWLGRVAVVVKESDEFLRDQVKANQMCFGGGSCPDLKSRYQVSRKAKKKTSVVDELLRERKKFDSFSHPATPPTIGSIIAMEDSEVFTSRKSIFNAMMEALKNDNINIIGVYGLGGVGKTTLVKEVLKQAEKSNLFDQIVMVVVSQTVSIKKIQGEIAEMLGLRLTEESEFVRVGRLCARLKDVKRILVILDDVWTILNLAAIGIPYGNAHKGCKIVLTSRNGDVCKEMSTQVFPIEVLPEEDAWKLFKKMAGDDKVKSPELHHIATEIVKECAGLPIAIVTIATALKSKSHHAWSDALHQLKNYTPKNIEGMHEKVYLSLQLSYNFLGTEEVKYFFLLCCLFPEDFDIPIENLVRYGMGLRLFGSVHNLEAARNRAHVLVDKLKACCLLLDSKDEGFVKMHDVIRDFAISVASEGQHVFLVRAAAGLEEWPEIDAHDHTAIGLLGNKFHELPDGLDCPKLNLLMLGCDSNKSLKIPDSFFEGMKMLRVVEMRADTPSLPPSIQCLKNLRTLCLENCKLRDISLIGELKDVLEILSFCGSDIEELPREIGQLTHLKLLDLTNCRQLTIIPAGIVSSLSHLEELRMINSFKQWGEDAGRYNARLVELKPLSANLSVLEMDIPDIKLCPKDLLFGNLIKFKISVGSSDFYESSKYPKALKFKVDQSISSYGGFNMLVKRAEHLILKGMKDLENVMCDSKREGFPSLKCLQVYYCHGNEYVVNTILEWTSRRVFPILEELELHSMDNLKEICHGHLPVEFFSELRELRLSELPELINLWKDPAGHACLRNLMVVNVYSCNKLKNLFSQYTARDLGKLQELNVGDCESLEEIFAHDGKGVAAASMGTEIVFQNLNSLYLRDLPNLTTFFPQENSWCSDHSLDAPTHPPLFNRKVLLPALDELTLYNLDKVKEIWHRQLSPDNFCKLRVLRIEECHNLIIVLTFNLRESLQNLEELSVESCDLVEEICELEGLVVKQGREAVPLPKIRELKLWRLPKLILMNKWWNKGPHGFLSLQNLKRLYIYKCNNLRNLFSSWATKGLSQLQYLEVESCEMMKEIVTTERAEEEEAIDKIVFPQLRTLQLLNLQKLTSFYQENHTSETLTIEECPRVKIFVSSGCPDTENLKASDEGFEAEMDQKGSLSTITRPPLFNEKVLPLTTLEELTLRNLNNVKEIWQRQLPLQNFCGLRVLSIWGFHNLITIIPSNLQQRLQNLEELDIQSCDLVEEVWELEGLLVDEEYETVTTLPQIRQLRLEGLPRLMNMWWNKGPGGVLSLHNLKSLNIYQCNGLKNLFSLSASKGLIQLQYLEIDSCGMMKEIVETERGEEETTADTIVFRQLHTLKLQYLPELMCVYQGNFTLEWPSLVDLRIDNCPKMRTFVSSRCLGAENLKECDKGFEEKLDEEGKLVGIIQPPFFNEKVLLPTLKTFTLRSLGSLKEIWQKQGQYSGDKVVFPQVHSLELINLPNLRSFYPGNLILELPSLETVRLEDCPNMHTFSSGLLITPKLYAIRVKNYEKLWEGDLNSTVQQLFKVKEEPGGGEGKEEEEILTAQVIHGDILTDQA